MEQQTERNDRMAIPAIIVKAFSWRQRRVDPVARVIRGRPGNQIADALDLREDLRWAAFNTGGFSPPLLSAALT
jgi:hypothetical protein